MMNLIILRLEHIPGLIKEGLIIPVHKGKGRDHFKQGSYRVSPQAFYLLSASYLKSSFFNM